ncbi:MAG: Gfo/Idh/MocA family oxidoreductase [Verrucomicrobia bacterium]|nr:Gfo/Idh/MocA family oxidoreductase [Verrucomicrobiota bacterium]
MKKIRVGMIRCDLHAIYYANVMQEHDPLVLREPQCGLGGYYYFYSQWNDPKKMTIPHVPGFEIVKVWDANRSQAENMRRIYRSEPTVCATFEDVSEEVDLVLIANCDLEGDDHLKLASPGIQRGVPTFIDKPLACDVDDARALISLAQQHDAPVLSLSIMRELPQATQFRDRFPELSRPTFGIIKVGAQPPNRNNVGLYRMSGLIHGISLAQHLFGAGVQSVEAMGGNEMPSIVHLDYGGAPERPVGGVVMNCGVGPTFHCALYASAYSELGSIHTGHLSDYEFPWGAVKIVEKIKKMVATRQPQAPYEEMIECIAIGTAARKSLAERRRVYLKEV